MNNSSSNFLAIDYGTKNVGLAYSVSGIISTLPAIKNDQHLFESIKKTISLYSIGKIYVGLSEGLFAQQTLEFVSKLRGMLELPVETVEEAVSTIEAAEIYRSNQGKQKNYKKLVDSVSAAVILRRVTS